MSFKGRKCISSMCGLCFNQTNMDTVIKAILPKDYLFCYLLSFISVSL